MRENENSVKVHEGDLVFGRDRLYVVATTPAADAARVSVLPVEVFEVSCQASPSYFPLTLLPKNQLRLEQAGYVGVEELERFFKSNKRMRHPEP